MKRISSFAAIVSLLAGVVVWASNARPSPSLDPVVLAREVIIRRDTFGIPHILGKTEEAASFGLGFAQSEDHGIEIARRFIGGRGEMAKYFGQSLEADLLIKRFDNANAVRKGFREMDPLAQRIITAYVAGVNYYFAQHRTDLPSWIPIFEPEDVLANYRAGLLRSLVDPATIRALRAKYEQASVPSTPGGGAEGQFAGDQDVQDDDGSNAFALSPSRTTSGNAILLGNPHLNWSSLYWEAQVTVPGRINFFGSTLVGIPVLRAGFNEHLGWVTTNNNPDLEDIYALKLDPSQADSYIFEGRSRPLVKKEVTAEAKGPDGVVKVESRSYWESHLGPIIHRNATLAFAVRSTTVDSLRIFEGFYRLSRARNLREWLEVIQMNLLPTSNYTYADAAGNILYQWNGRVPKRLDDGTSYDLDVPAETSKYVWNSLHPVAELPRVLNPSGGYIQNCNNPPWFVSLRDPLDPKRYPSYFERGELGLRPQMTLEMLESRPKFSFEQVRELKYNTRMLLADRVKPDLLRALKLLPRRSEDLNRGLAVLEAWDNRVSAESRGGVLFQRFWDQYRLGLKQPFGTPWSSLNPARTPTGIADIEKAITSFEAAVGWTRATYGSEAVPWGDVHRFRFRDIDLPADGASGAYGLFRVMGFRDQDGGKRLAGWTADGEPLMGFGDGWVLSVEFSRPIVAYSVLAYGQTTNSASPHSRDQIGLFAKHSYKRVWFTESEIKSNLERTYHP
ncbi:MAG: penicillin acylase family protein [Acidobacteriota bacterium]